MTPSASEYLRPSTLAQALSLLARTDPPSRPLAGGTQLSWSSESPGCLVDLRGLALEGIAIQGTRWQIGAMATLADLAGHPTLPQALRLAARHEAPGNLQVMATVGGTVALGRSGPLLVALLADAAVVEIEPGARRIPIEALVLDHTEPSPRGSLIVWVSIAEGSRLGLAEISRTPEDRPVLCLCVGGRWEQGRIREARVACGAYGQPLALLPGVARALEGQDLPLTAEAAEQASLSEDVHWVEDIRGSSQYRARMIPVLLKRATEQLVESGAARP